MQPEVSESQAHGLQKVQFAQRAKQGQAASKVWRDQGRGREQREESPLAGEHKRGSSKVPRKHRVA